jgi:glycolate oxidase iron-sulfur subunit
MTEQLLTSPAASVVFKIGNPGKLKRNSQQETAPEPTSTDGKAQLLLIPGCATTQITPETTKKAVYLLNKAAYSSEILASPTCCGALFRHHGNDEKANKLLEQISNKYQSNQYIGVIHLTSGCSNYLNTQETVNTTQSIYPYLLANKTLLKFENTSKVNVAIHTPCSSDKHSTQQITELLKLIPNLQVDIIPNSHGCCGAAGSFMLSNTKVANQLRQPITEHIQQSNYDIVISANIGCALHLQGGLPSTLFMHPIDILFKYLRP